MKFPVVPFPKLADPCLAVQDKISSLSCQARGTPPHWVRRQKLLPGSRALAGGGGRERGQVPFGFGGWSQAASMPLFPCHSSLGASGLPRSPSLGLFFAGLGCPLRGEGAGSKGGEKEQLYQHNPGRLCSCPPWPSCHPLPEGPVPGHNGDPDRCGTSSPGVEIDLSALTLSHFILLPNIRARKTSELKQSCDFFAHMGKLRPGERTRWPKDTVHTGPLSRWGLC